jgi:acyl-CoA oxidase
MPGIELGDMGAKFGFAMMDNGYMRLNHVRVPRINMLAKLAEVTPEGRFVKKLDSKVAYGAMLRIRVGITIDAAIKLSRATTIAIRYAVQRRQFRGPEGAETKILDY